LDFPLELLITGITIIVGNVITLKWLKSDLVKHEKVYDSFVKENSMNCAKLKEDINKLFVRTSGVMHRNDVDHIVKNQLEPITKDISALTIVMQDMSKSMNSMDKSMAVISDRANRLDAQRGNTE